MIKEFKSDFIQFRRRTYVRTVFANIEGVVFAIKRKILEYGKGKLSTEEKIKLQEKQYCGPNKKELVEKPGIITYVADVIEKKTSDLAPFEKIKTFKLLPNLFTIEADELTPTLKIKRKVVEKKYTDLIEQMYEKN